MYEKTTTVLNKTGIHARPAAVFSSAAKKFQSNITVTNLSAEPVKSGNAKSIIQLMTMNLTKGTQISLKAEGEDEQAAVDALIALVESGCGENL